MFKDKKPGKWVLLILLFLIVMIGILAFFGLSARANEKFLKITEVKTKSDISIWMVEDHTLPIVSMQFLFEGAGGSLDPADKQGVARMLSNTMDEGAGDLTSEAFQKSLADHSITLMFNADRDNFSGQVKTLSRHKETAFNLLELALQSPRFDEEPVARMRDGNIARIKTSMAEPEWMAARLLNDRLFDGHPYAMNAGGTLSTLPKITNTDIRTFYKENLTQDRLLVAIVGDITPDEAKKYVDKVFGKLPQSGKKGEIPHVASAHPGKMFLYKQDFPQTVIEYALPTFDRTDKDYYALQVMNYIYGGGGFGSRLMDKAREQRGLTYGIYSSLQDMQYGDFLNVRTQTKNQSAQEILAIIHDEMEKMKSSPVSEKELEDAKSYMIGSMPLSVTSTDDIAGMVLGLRAAHYPIDYLDQYAQNVKAVTSKDVLRVANRVLKPENAVTILVGYPANIKDATIVKELPNVQ